MRVNSRLPDAMSLAKWHALAAMRRFAEVALAGLKSL
jgi:hypothetical protein